MLKELTRFEKSQLDGWIVSKHADIKWQINIPEGKRLGFLELNFGSKPKQSRGIFNLRKTLSGIESGIVRVRIFLSLTGINSGFIRLLDFKHRKIIGMTTIPPYTTWKEVAAIGYLSNEKQATIDFAINFQLNFRKKKKKAEEKDILLSIKWIEVHSGPDAAIFTTTRVRQLFELPKEMRIAKRALLGLNYLLTTQGMTLIQEARAIATTAGRRIVLPRDIDQARENIFQMDYSLEDIRNT